MTPSANSRRVILLSIVGLAFLSGCTEGSAKSSAASVQEEQAQAAAMREALRRQSLVKAQESRLAAAGKSTPEVAQPPAASAAGNRSESAQSPAKQKPTNASKRVRVTPERRDFGEVGHGGKLTHKFKVENPGRDPIKITKVKPTCDCMEVSFDPGTLAPGESREGSVEVSVGANTFGHHVKHVHIYLGEEEHAEIDISWDVHPNLERPNRLELIGELGRETPDGKGSIKLTRKKAKSAPIEVRDLRIEGLRASEGKLRVSSNAVGPEEAAIVVELTAEHPAGSVSGKVHAVVDGLPFIVSVQGTVYHAIRTKPNAFQFHQIKDPDDASCTLELIPLDGREFKILSIDVEPKAVAVEVRPRAEGGHLLVAKPIPPFPNNEKNMPLGGIGGIKVTVKTDHPEKPEILLKAYGIVLSSKNRGIQETEEGK